MEWEGFDDADSIAAEIKSRAVRSREISVKGALRMLDREPRFEDVEIGFVLDVELLDALGERRAEGAEAIVEELLPRVRERLTAANKKKRPRALYALIRLLGVEDEVVTEGLTGTLPMRRAALRALVDPAEPDGEPRRPRFEELPGGLLPHLSALIESEAASVHLLEALARVRSPEVTPYLLRLLEHDELRSQLLSELTAPERRFAPLTSLPEELFSRFDQAASVIERAREGGFPNRVELVVAASIAAMAGPDTALARRALDIFDLVPGVLPRAGAGVGDRGARARVLRERLLPFCALLLRSADLLDEEERARLASFLGDRLPQRYPAAAAAWVRLPPPRALAMSRGWPARDPKRGAARWEAVAEAYAAHPAPAPELGSLFRARLASVGSSEPLLRALSRVRLEGAEIEAQVRGARRPAELREALELAAMHGHREALRPALRKLREGPFRLDEAMAEVLLPLLDRSSVELVREEIEGENPFPDRCASLAQLLQRAAVAK